MKNITVNIAIIQIKIGILIVNNGINTRNIQKHNASIEIKMKSIVMALIQIITLFNKVTFID